MKVLVAGGAGYIGSVACEALIRAGHGVVVLDSLIQGHRAAVPREAEFVQGDLGDLAAVRAAFSTHRPEAVMHFAGHVRSGESMREPFSYLDENVRGGLNLMRGAVESGARRFILSSTSHVFSRPARIPIVESEPPSPATPYGEAKLYLERALAWLEKTHGLRATALRYFNAAGATKERGEHHDPETHLIPLVLATAAGRRATFTLFGADYDTPDGTCIRDYIHVSDLADAHVRALAPCGPLYHLGNGGGFSVKEVIESARRVTGRPIAVETAPRRPGDPARLVADSSLIRKDLGWSPRIPDLDLIVRSAWAWIESHPQGYPH